jgi:NADPH-dependent 2,4-dienoyl-CoA reductase/sulfur reductase-like enzyme
MNKISTELLIVGGGAAGMSAAFAASDRARVTIVDDNPHLGGQIWRAELGKIKSAQAIELTRKVESGKVRIFNNAQIFASAGSRSLLAETPDGRLELGYEKLIIATGARERFLPFPGWTLPGVFGAGGLQALVKGGLSVNGKRVAIAGTGPLLLAVADYLKTRGAKITAIAEQTSALKIRRFGLQLISRPSKLAQALAIRSRLLRIPYLTSCWVTNAIGDERLMGVSLTSGGRTWDVECDYLACGFHLIPNIELAVLLGCRIENGCVAVDEFQRTSADDIFCAGEPTGIAGVESSLVEGTIACFAATGQTAKARAHFAERNKARRFGDALNSAFALRDELKTLANSETIVCRCEDVTYGSLTDYSSSREAKLQTRCGMGPCQGRICGAANEFLFGWKPGTVRPPIFPVKMEYL